MEGLGGSGCMPVRSASCIEAGFGFMFLGGWWVSEGAGEGGGSGFCSGWGEGRCKRTKVAQKLWGWRGEGQGMRPFLVMVVSWLALMISGVGVWPGVSCFDSTRNAEAPVLVGAW